MQTKTQRRVEQALARYVRWKRRRRIRPTLEQGLFAPYWDDLACFLFKRGYSWYTLRRVIEVAKPLATYAEKQLGVLDVAALSEEVVAGYVEARPRNESRRCLRLLLLFLRDRGIVPPAADPSASARRRYPVVAEFLDFLRDHRGTGQATAERHRRHVEALLSALGGPAPVEELRSLTGADVRRFITSRAGGLSRGQRKAMCAALRTFLRFLFLRGYTSLDLVSAVPILPSFKLERLPTAISTDAIERILAAVDRSTPVGRRDYAMLLLLATYGLRAGQLCALRLDDIDWRRQLLRIPGAKGGRDAVYPLHPAVGEAIVDYLRHGRPVGWSFRQLFLRVRAPVGPLRGVLANNIEPYARRAGVEVPSLGAHAWRHACATRMLARGQSLKTIRHLLGHRSIETTFIYTKVDLAALRQAALEWPEPIR
jgi:site-specific recombinase XerD